jgi:hypothetical protein
MPQPSRDRRHVDPALDATSREEVSEVVMSQPLQACPLARFVQAAANAGARENILRSVRDRSEPLQDGSQAVYGRDRPRPRILLDAGRDLYPIWMNV